MARPKKSKKFVQLSCRTTEEIERFVESIADEMGLPKSVVGGELIRIGVESCQQNFYKLFTNYTIQGEHFAMLKTA